MSFSKSFVLFTMVSSLFITVSCKDYVGKEDSHPQYKSAIAAKEGKEYAKAAECFHDFLLICPKSARTHYELAVLCMDNLQDYESAIAHFRMYERLLDGNLSDKEIDNIIGVLNVKTFFKQYVQQKDVRISKTLQKPYFVSSRIMIDDLFNGFKKRQTHIAFVRGNKMNIIGMVTMDDVLEELVGNIGEVDSKGGNK
mgnify:CR=1 FL=1